MARKYNLSILQSRHASRLTSGLTLIELLIAVFISVTVIVSVLTLFLRSQESAAYLNAASRIQENGRFATDQLARILRMARYDDSSTTGVTAIEPGLEGKISTDSLSMTGYTLKTDTDAIQVSYEGVPGVVNCQGVEFVTAHTMNNLWVTNTFAISSNNELICRTQDSSGAVGDPLVIADGVEDMDILYGIDSDADGVSNRYVHENFVGDWSQVVSAKITLLINSVDTLWSGTLHACESCDVFAPTANNLLRGEFHTTVRLRNI